MSHYQTDTIFHCYRRLPLMRTCCAATHIIYIWIYKIYICIDNNNNKYLLLPNLRNSCVICYLFSICGLSISFPKTLKSIRIFWTLLVHHQHEDHHHWNDDCHEMCFLPTKFPRYVCIKPEYGCTTSAPSCTPQHPHQKVHTEAAHTVPHQKVLLVNQKVDSVTALRHRIAIIPIHTFSAPLLGPNYKPQTEKGDPRKSLNWILGPIWWLRSVASRFKYTLYNLCQEARKKRHSRENRRRWKLTRSCRRSSRTPGSPSPRSLSSFSCSSRLDGLLPTAALLLGRNNGRRAAIGRTGGAGQLLVGSAGNCPRLLCHQPYLTSG